MFPSLRRLSAAVLAAVAVLAACHTSPTVVDSDQWRARLVDSMVDNLVQGDSVVANPETVTDLSVSGTTDTSVSLTFTEVNDGTGQPASYFVRYSVSPISWGSALDVSSGTCAVPMAGTTVGADRTCTILGLSASTAYQFQLVSFRGTLNQDAVFGGLSNVVDDTTLAARPPAPGDTTEGSPSGGWPNQPAGFRVLSDQPWDLLTGNGWYYLRRSSSKDATILVDTTAPRSPPSGLRMVFTTDMERDHEPSVHWTGLPGVREIYTASWIKLSPNWSCSWAGCGKITFLFANGGAGQVYTNYYHHGGDASSGWVPGPSYRIGVNTEWAPYGQRIWLPNVTTTYTNPGAWHLLEFYYRWESTPGVSGDGIIRWWVDGVLNGDYTNIHYPSGYFIELQYAPTLQNPPPAEQYMDVDHTRVSVP